MKKEYFLKNFDIENLPYSPVSLTVSTGVLRQGVIKLQAFRLGRLFTEHIWTTAYVHINLNKKLKNA